MCRNNEGEGGSTREHSGDTAVKEHSSIAESTGKDCVKTGAREQRLGQRLGVVHGQPASALTFLLQCTKCIHYKRKRTARRRCKIKYSSKTNKISIAIATTTIYF